MNLDKIVCSCLNITNGSIRNVVYAGANTVEAVQETTGAGAACGVCLEDIQRLVDFFVAERDR